MGGNSHFNQLIVTLILAYRHKKKYICVRYFPKMTGLLDILVDINYISNYNFNRSSVVVFLSYNAGQPSWSGVKIYNKPSRPIRTNSRAVREIFFYNRSYMAIILTRAGLVTTDEMVRTNMSGRLLYVFF